MPFETDNMLHDKRWRQLRDNGGGGVSADADFTDPANLAAFIALVPQSTPSRTPDGDEVKQIVFYVVGYNAAGAVLARGSAAFDLLVYEFIRTHDIRENDLAGVSIPSAVIDSAPISTNVTLSRKIAINAKGINRFQIGIQNLANMPATLDRFRIFWRPE